MQTNDQIVSVIPAFLQEGKVADVEEVKGSGHINYSVALFGTLTKGTNLKDIRDSWLPCSWRTRGVSVWSAGTGRVPSTEIWPLLLCSSRRRPHGQPGFHSWTIVSLKLFQMGHVASPGPSQIFIFSPSPVQYVMTINNL